MNAHTEGQWEIGDDPGPDEEGFAKGPIDIISADGLTVVCTVADGLPWHETRANAERIVSLHNEAIA